MLNCLVFCVVLLCIFTFWVPYCDVRYDFHIRTIFGSYLPLVDSWLFYFCVCLCIVVSNTYCVVFLFHLFSSCILCTPCCQFLWIVHFWLPLRFSLTFFALGRIRMQAFWWHSQSLFFSILCVGKFARKKTGQKQSSNIHVTTDPDMWKMNICRLTITYVDIS